MEILYSDDKLTSVDTFVWEKPVIGQYIIGNKSLSGIYQPMYLILNQESIR